MIDNNIFSKIVNNKVKMNFIYKDKFVTVFNDINPKSLVHIIIIPNVYIKNLNYVNNSNIKILGKLLITSSKIAKEKKIDKSGYRVVINCNNHSGQEIDYLHLHLLGGNYLGDFVSVK